MADAENGIHPPAILGKTDPMIALDVAEQLSQHRLSTLAELYRNMMLNLETFRQTGRTLSGLTEVELEERISSIISQLEELSTPEPTDTRRSQNDPPKL